jgi:parallel beta-helix repeat protein
VAAVSGTADRPITLCGSRAAILEGRSIESGNGFTLTADHWVLSGFGVRNARKGIVVEGGSHNILRALEVYQIGEEGVHFRRFSTDNLLEHSWVHHVGQLTPIYGEGVYVGSAHSNWPTYSQGRPDTCDRNRVISNLIGPSTTAESVDIKEGSTGGVVADNTFLGSGMTAADSWVDVKGNGFVVSGNAGLSTQGSGFKRIEINQALSGWGVNNDVRDNAAHAAVSEGAAPFRAASDGGGPATIVLLPRALPYRLSELIARFPESIEPVALGAWLLKEHIMVARGARLEITRQDARELRLLSDDARFVSIVTFRGQLALSGVDRDRMAIRSWNPAANGPDQIHRDGRAYILARGGRMDIDQADFSELGFGMGHASGVAWQGLSDEKSLGNVTGARFERNFYGAYTFEAEAMRWVGNRFADNVGYGFDPHDFSNHFLFEGNTASGNGTHGIIFSRGCSGNIIRRNSSFDNRGFGIMLDDGKVRDDGNSRHARPVPSDDNIVEENRVWGNKIGIVLEGGARNAVRANDIHDNQFGISVKDNVRESEIISNTIRASASFAIYIYNQSHKNRIIGNVLDGGQGGIVINESSANVILGNMIAGIQGRGLVLDGDMTNTVIAHNTLAGQGSNAIDISNASDLDPNALGDNRTDGWTTTGPPTLIDRATNVLWYHPALLIWATFLLFPLLAWWPAHRRRQALLRDRASR